MLVRLQKLLAEAGLGSRRHCEELIRQGQVAVNGQTVSQLGTRVNPAADRVCCGDKPVAIERKVYLMLNKPRGVVCTSRDPHAHKCVLDLVPRSLPRLYSVGRLDKDSEGLLLLTNDGTFSLRLAHPRYKMHKVYLVEVAGELNSDQIARLLKGVACDGERLGAEKVFQVRPRGATTELQVVLSQGRKRQIRRMMAAVGHPVKRLVRLAVGPFDLGDLKPGQWRYLQDEEVQKIVRF